MQSSIEETIEVISIYIQRITEEGSSEEVQLLPELINSLANLVKVTY